MTWAQAFTRGVYGFVTLFGFLVCGFAAFGIIAFVAHMLGALARNDDDDFDDDER